MGDGRKVIPTTKDQLRNLLDPSDKGTNIGGLIDPGGTIIKRTTGSDIGQELADPAGVVSRESPVKIAEEEAKKAQTKIAGQRRSEAARLAAAEASVKERSGRLRGGRSLLIATSPTGTRAQTLGGA